MRIRWSVLVVLDGGVGEPDQRRERERERDGILRLREEMKIELRMGAEMLGFGVRREKEPEKRERIRR